MHIQICNYYYQQVQHQKSPNVQTKNVPIHMHEFGKQRFHCICAGLPTKVVKQK